MKKKCQIIMLPTKEESNIYKSRFSTGLGYKDIATIYTIEDQGQHLFVLSNEEIKEGDYFYNPSTKEILFASKEMIIWNSDTGQSHKGWKKLIATTDSIYINNINTCNKLPKISKKFIENYIEKYNSMDVITDIEVEYQYYCCVNGIVDIKHLEFCNRIPCRDVRNAERLLINLDNTIKITEIE